MGSALPVALQLNDNCKGVLRQTNSKISTILKRNSPSASCAFVKANLIVNLATLDDLHEQPKLWLLDISQDDKTKILKKYDNYCICMIVILF